MTVDSWTALKYQLGAWKVYGILPPPDDPIKRRLYIFHAFFVNIVALLGLWFTFSMKVVKADNLGELLEYMYPLITCSSVVLKIINCFLLRHHLLGIRMIFKKLDSRAKSNEEQRLLLKAIKRVHIFFRIFAQLTAGITTSGVLIVIFSDDKPLFFPAWYPWDYTRSRRIYLLTLTHQLYAIIFVALQETANAAYPQAYLEMLTAHIKTLRLRVLRLANLDKHAKATSSIKAPLNDDQQIYDELSACIQDHMVILDLYNKIQEVLSVHCLIQLSATGLVQCAIAISVLYTDTSEFSKIMQMLIFLGAITIEMFILCFSGEMFCQECERLSVAIYDCNWVGQSLHFQKAILFFLHRSQQFSVIMAGNFLPINYPTFVQLVKGSYSVFTLLNNFRGK